MGLGGVRNYYIPYYLSKLGWKVKVFTPQPPEVYPGNRELSTGKTFRVKRSISPDPLHLLPKNLSRPASGRRDYISFPDNKILWLPFLKKSLTSMDVMITSHPPFSTLLCGLSTTSTPWIIDFRDPWSNDYLGKYFFNWEEDLCKSLEKYSIKKSSSAVTVTRNHYLYLRQKYPSFSKKINLIRNGFCEEIFPENHLKRDLSDNFIITYMGTLNRHHNPDIFFRALKSLYREKELQSLNIIFRHIGHSAGIDLNQMSADSGIKELEEKGYMKHEEAIRQLYNSHVLLLLGEGKGKDRRIIPGKLYEYLRTGLPILAITDNIEIAELINGAGIQCKFKINSIKEGLKKITENYKKFKPVEDYKKYSWKSLSQKYSNLLLSVL